MTTHLVVTGAGGFIGRHVVSSALRAGHRVTALVRPGRRVDELSADPRLVVADWDAATEAPRGSLFDDASAVCHLAAFYPPDMAAAAHAEECLRVNAIGTLRLLETICDRDIHLVHVSAGQLYCHRGLLAAEDDPVWPASRAVYYLSSKMLAELYVDYFAEHFGLAATTLRVGSVYGPGMHHGAVHRFLTQAHNALPIEIASDNRYAVDLVFVADVVRAILAAVERPYLGVLNIGSGAATSLEQLACESLAACDAPASLMWRVDAAGPADPGFDGLDITRAREHLDFTPTPLAHGLRATLQMMFRT